MTQNGPVAEAADSFILTVLAYQLVMQEIKTIEVAIFT